MLAFIRKTDAQIFAGRRFAGAALLIGTAMIVADIFMRLPCRKICRESAACGETHFPLIHRDSG